VQGGASKSINYYKYKIMSLLPDSKWLQWKYDRARNGWDGCSESMRELGIVEMVAVKVW
jgi:hypothetical protein